VKEGYVKDYVTHLQHLAWIKEMRSKQRKSQVATKKSKTVNDYDWQALLTEGNIGKLTACELDKYLEHQHLPLNGKKADKVRTIAAHLSSDFLRGQATVQVLEDTDEESDEEIVTEVSPDIGDVEEQPIRSRSGRTVKRKDYGDYHVY
jgi:hypothetical protein